METFELTPEEITTLRGIFERLHHHWSDPEIMEALKQQIAKLPLESYVTLLLLLKPSIFRDGTGVWDLYRENLHKLRNAITTGGLSSFPMDEEHIRTIFLLTFSTHNELLSRVEDLEERVIYLKREFEGRLESSEREIGCLDSALRKVENKTRHLMEK